MSDGRNHRLRGGGGLMAPSSVLIVGAGLAGARCAETLRAAGFAGRLVLVGDELLAPYERPALSKEYLAGTKPESELLLRAPSSWAEREIDLSSDSGSSTSTRSSGARQLRAGRSSAGTSSSWRPAPGRDSCRSRCRRVSTHCGRLSTRGCSARPSSRVPTWWSWEEALWGPRSRRPRLPSASA